MPLSEKTRIEVYVPDLPLPAYQQLLISLQREFSYDFGGSTLVRGLSGTYLSQLGPIIEDRVNLLYVDAALHSSVDADLIGRYAEALRSATYRALDEEPILIATYPVQHAG